MRLIIIQIHILNKNKDWRSKQNKSTIWKRTSRFHFILFQRIHKINSPWDSN